MRNSLWRSPWPWRSWPGGWASRSATTRPGGRSALEQLRRDVAGRWLLIFDDAEDPEVLAPFLPTGSGHILITSRNQAWTRHAEPLELDVFSQQESLAHLRQHVPGLDAPDAARCRQPG